MAIGDALANALETCLDRAQSVIRLGQQLRSSIGLETRREPAPLPDLLPPTGAPHPIERARFHISQAPSGCPSAGVAPPIDDLPAAYGYDRIVLLVRDPWSAFAYWEVTPATQADATRRLGIAKDRLQTTLRIYDESAPGLPGQRPLRWSDLDIPSGVESWHLKLPHPGGSFFIEIGLKTSEGQFFAFARSATVTPPRTSPARDDATTWVTPGERPSILPAREPAD